MTRFGRALVWSVVVYQLVLTWVLLRLADYMVWLHFDCGNPERACESYPLLSTVPGAQAVWVVGIAIIVIAGVLAFRALEDFKAHERLVEEEPLSHR